MEVLQSDNILVGRTIKSNQNYFLQMYNEKKLKRSNYDYRATPLGITVFKWKDINSIYLIFKINCTRFTFTEFCLKNTYVILVFLLF